MIRWFYGASSYSEGGWGRGRLPGTEWKSAEASALRETDVETRNRKASGFWGGRTANYRDKSLGKGMGELRTHPISRQFEQAEQKKEKD